MTSNDDAPWVPWLAAILVGLLVGFCVYTQPAPAHEQAGFKYDDWCCSVNDCGPMAKAFQLDGLGVSSQALAPWWYTNHRGKSAPYEPGYTQLKQSPDGLTHVCVWTDHMGRDRLRCLYVPGGN